MAPMRENKVMKWIQTILLTIITGAIIWAATTLVEVKIFMATYNERQISANEKTLSFEKRMSQVENTQTREGASIEVLLKTVSEIQEIIKSKLTK